MLACRPMLSLAVAVMAGVLLERYIPLFENYWPYGLLILAVAIGLFSMTKARSPTAFPESLPEEYRPLVAPMPGFFASRGLNRFILILCLGAAFVGMARQAAWRRELDPDRLPGKRWFNAGLVALAPSHAYPGETGGVSIRADLVEVNGQPVAGLPLRLRSNDDFTFRRGDVLHCRVEKMGVYPPAYPGAFSFAFFIERDRQLGTVRIVKPFPARENDTRPKLRVTPRYDPPLRLRTMRVVDDIRGVAIRQTLDYGGSQGGLLAAMLFGYRKNIGDDVRDVFRRVGIGHVLAISGLHVGLVVLMFWWFGGWLRLTSRPRALVSLFLTALYWGLTGGQVAATRAALMASIHLLGIAYGRRADMLNSLGAAAFLIALHNPTAPLDVSFQLSFTAVVFIYMAMRRLPDTEPERRTPDPRYNAVWRRRTVRKIVSLTWLSIATWVGLFPIIALVFQQVNLAGLPINIIVIPWMSVVLAGGLLMPLVGWIPGVGWLLAAPSHALTWFAGVVDAVPGSSFAAHAPAKSWIFVFYLFAALWMMRPMVPIGRIRRRWDFFALCGILVGAGGIVFTMRSYAPPASGRIAMLPGAGLGIVAAEAPDGSIAVFGKPRRGGMNEAAWLHYLHRGGKAAIVSVGKMERGDLSAFAWRYPIAELTVLKNIEKADANAGSGWLETPGAPGIDYAVWRDERGRLIWLSVRAGDKCLTTIPRISVNRFAGLLAERIAGYDAGLFSLSFYDSSPEWHIAAESPVPAAVRGRLPEGGGAAFFRKTDYGVLLLDEGVKAFDGVEWRDIGLK